MAENHAAWIDAPKSQFVVKPAPYPKPAAGEVVIKTAAIAVNPMEWKIQAYNPPIGGRPLQYPNILGADAAGTVVSLGDDVHALKVGQRVVAHCIGFAVGRPASSAFQEYIVYSAAWAMPIPDHLDFEHAVVLPLSIDTAITGLFLPDHLSLEFPADPPEGSGTLLVWGGSSSVGCSVIQLAKAAGYDVVTVAGKKNRGLCAELGADVVIDHAQPDVIERVVEALTRKKVVGAFDCIGEHDATTRPCAEILAKSQGRKLVVSVLEPPHEGLPSGVEAVRCTIRNMLGTDLPVKTRAWLGKALNQGKFIPNPEPLVVGHGLEHIQAAVDILRKGVSAAKVIVTV